MDLESDLFGGIVPSKGAFRIILGFRIDLALDNEAIAELDTDHVDRRAGVILFGHAIDRHFAELGERPSDLILKESGALNRGALLAGAYTRGAG